MSVSRFVPVFRAGSNLSKGLFLKPEKIVLKMSQPIRCASQRFTYRTVSKASPWEFKRSIAMNAIVWWWTLWFFMLDYHEYFGVAPPDPSKWTDEELGIPPL